MKRLKVYFHSIIINHPFSLVKPKQIYYHFEFCKCNEFFDERRSAAFYPASQQRAPIKIRGRRSGSAWSHKLYIFFVLIPEGKRHDAWMLGESHLLNDLERFAFSTSGQPMCIYGDPAYPVRVHLQSPYKGNRLMPAMEAFNESMSKVRTSVEWVFGDIVRSGLGIYIHHYSPPVRGIVGYYYRSVQFCM